MWTRRRLAGACQSAGTAGRRQTDQNNPLPRFTGYSRSGFSATSAAKA